jgi:hypothetical protein
MLATPVLHRKAPARVLPQWVARATVPVVGFRGWESVMRGVAAALPLSIVGVLILSSAAWACGDRPGDMCGRDQRGSPEFKWDRPGRDRSGWEWFARVRAERDRIRREEIRREVEEESNAIIEEGMRKADAKMREAIALKRNTETLQAYLSEEIARAKKTQEEAAQHQHDADEKAKQADEAKRAADDQLKLLKADRERHEARLIEILAHDPCGTH